MEEPAESLESIPENGMQQTDIQPSEESMSLQLEGAMECVDQGESEEIIPQQMELMSEMENQSSIDSCSQQGIFKISEETIKVITS